MTDKKNGNSSLVMTLLKGRTLIVLVVLIVFLVLLPKTFSLQIPRF